MAQAYLDLHRLYRSAQGIKMNENGGFYRHGKSYYAIVRTKMNTKENRQELRWTLLFPTEQVVIMGMKYVLDRGAATWASQTIWQAWASIAG